MIDIRKLKELVRLMVENDLVEIDLRDQQEQVTVKRPNSASVPMIAHHSALHAAPAPTAATPAAAHSGGKSAASDAGLVPIESPMVGTFYQAPGPDKPPFVSVGSPVGPDTVVCLLEAMKIFNEIKAGVSGTIERVVVKAGDPVEFGQALFLVRPS